MTSIPIPNVARRKKNIQLIVINLLCQEEFVSEYSTRLMHAKIKNAATQNKISAISLVLKKGGSLIYCVKMLVIKSPPALSCSEKLSSIKRNSHVNGKHKR